MEININGILPEIAVLDLEMIKMKLMDEDEGVGWVYISEKLTTQFRGKLTT